MRIKSLIVIAFLSFVCCESQSVKLIGGAKLLKGTALTKVTPSTGGGGGISSPLDIANCILWLDGSDSTKLYTDAAMTVNVTADGDPVGGWKDKSAGVNDFTQSTAANRPTYKTGIKNSKSVVRFDGSNDALSKAMSAQAAHTVFIVYISNTSAGGIYGTVLVTSGFRGAYAEGRGTGTYVDNLYMSVGPDHRSPTMTAGTTWNIFIYDIDGAGSGNAYVNNNAAYFSGASDNSFSYNYIGNDTLGDLLNGDIAEIVVYSRQLNSTERGQVETYLNTKWNIH